MIYVVSAEPNNMVCQNLRDLSVFSFLKFQNPMGNTISTPYSKTCFRVFHFLIISTKVLIEAYVMRRRYGEKRSSFLKCSEWRYFWPMIIFFTFKNTQGGKCGSKKKLVWCINVDDEKIEDSSATPYCICHPLSFSPVSAN